MKYTYVVYNRFERAYVKDCGNDGLRYVPDLEDATKYPSRARAHHDGTPADDHEGCRVHRLF